MTEQPIPTHVKMDDTRIPVIEGEYKGHIYFADHFGYRITYRGFRVISAQEGCKTATSTSVQRAKLAIDTLCEAYSPAPSVSIVLPPRYYLECGDAYNPKSEMKAHNDGGWIDYYATVEKLRAAGVMCAPC